MKHPEMEKLTGRDYITSEEADRANTQEGPLAQYRICREELIAARNRFHDAKTHLVISTILSKEVIEVHLDYLEERTDEEIK